MNSKYSFRFLGVEISNFLIWQGHVVVLTVAAEKKMGFLFRPPKWGNIIQSSEKSISLVNSPKIGHLCYISSLLPVPHSFIEFFMSGHLKKLTTLEIPYFVLVRSWFFIRYWMCESAKIPLIGGLPLYGGTIGYDL